MIGLIRNASKEIDILVHPLYNNRIILNEKEPANMVKHIVLFKLSDNSPANCEKTAAILRSMDGKVDLLRGITVGVDNLHSPRSYDIALEVLLDDMAALEAYQQDEYHCDVVKKHMHSVACGSVAIDFDI